MTDYLFVSVLIIMFSNINCSWTCLLTGPTTLSLHSNRQQFVPFSGSASEPGAESF
jgi:hypothetical protein